MEQTRVYELLVEDAARLVYEAMFGRKDSTPPWTHHGYLDAQNKAREVARQLVDGVPGSFGWALAHAKRGSRIQRAGWNGKGMWVALSPGIRFSPEAAREGAAWHRAEELRSTPPAAEYVDIVTLPRLDMRAADGSITIGWNASQPDMLADDWSVLP